MKEHKRNDKKKEKPVFTPRRSLGNETQAGLAAALMLVFRAHIPAYFPLWLQLSSNLGNLLYLPIQPTLLPGLWLGVKCLYLHKGQTQEGGRAWGFQGKGRSTSGPRLEPTEAGPPQRQVVWRHRVDSLNFSWWTEELAGVRWKSRRGLHNRPPSRGAGCCSEHPILLLGTCRATKTTWTPGGPHMHQDPGTLIWKANLLKMAIKLSLLIGKKGLITIES